MTAVPNDNSDRRRNLFTGALLAITALLGLVMILHHPALQGQHDLNDFAARIQPMARMDRLVHGSLIVILGVQVLGFYFFSSKLGFSKPVVVAGFMAFAGGVIMMAIPATLDGFVTPDLAARCLHRPQGCVGEDAGAFALIATMIQDFTKLAFVSMSAGTAFWSSALLVRKGLLDRSAALVGFACAIIPVWTLMTATVTLKAGNLAQFFAAQVVWALVAAVVLLHDRNRPTLSVAADAGSQFD